MKTDTRFTFDDIAKLIATCGAGGLHISPHAGLFVGPPEGGVFIGYPDVSVITNPAYAGVRELIDSSSPTDRPAKSVTINCTEGD